MKKMKIMLSLVSLISCAAFGSDNPENATVVVSTLKEYQRLLTAVSGKSAVTYDDSHKLLKAKWYRWEDMRSPNMNLTEQEAAVAMAGSVDAIVSSIERNKLSGKTAISYIANAIGGSSDDLRKLNSYPTNNATMINFQNFMRPLVQNADQ